MQKQIFTTAAAVVALTNLIAIPAHARFLQTDPIGYEDQQNIYAYVFNDPINNVDPTGEECVNNTEAGSTRCVTADYDVTVPTAKGFQNTNPGADDYHYYQTDKTSPIGAADTRAWVRSNPTPGNPSPAPAQGTQNNATPVGLNLVVDSPVMSYTTVNQVTGNSVVVNMTLPGHPLGNGVVVRDVAAGPSGTSVIQNFGEGNGALQAPGSPVAGLINNTFAAPGMAPPPPVTPAQRNRIDFCQRFPGANC